MQGSWGGGPKSEPQPPKLFELIKFKMCMPEHLKDLKKIFDLMLIRNLEILPLNDT